MNKQLTIILERLQFWSSRSVFWRGVALLDDDYPEVIRIGAAIARDQFVLARERAKDTGIWYAAG